MNNDTNTFTSEEAVFNERYQWIILLTIIGIWICGFLFSLIKYQDDRFSVCKLCGSSLVCTQDVIFDWLLIIQWYQTGNTSWASWILAAALVGGYISAETLRQRETVKYDIPPQRTKIILLFCIDFLGFSPIRTLSEEFLLMKKIKDTHNPEWEKDLLDLTLCIQMGGLVESLMSFTVVGYCIILGTVAHHQDVTTPSILEYLSLISSYFGILFKIFIFITADENWKTIIPREKQRTCFKRVLEIINAKLSLWFLTNCIVLPAFILAQNTNKVSIPMCPDVISSNTGLSYLPSVMLFTFVFVRLFYYQPDKVWVEIPSILLIDLCSIWIVVTQIWIQFYGKFNTTIGESICYFWTMGAIMRILQTICHLVFCKGKYEWVYENYKFMQKNQLQISNSMSLFS